MTKGKELTVNNAKDLMQVNITKEDIKKYFCPLASDKEIFMAFGVIKSLNLNPYKKEVHLVKYKQAEKLSIIVGYEVYLKRAERTGNLAGWEAGTSEDKKKTWVKIWRKDWTKPFYWEVVLSEFDKGQATWKQIPSFMGKKVAIAQGFRLCFPDELGGMPYTKEEHQVYDIINVTPKSTKPDVEMPKSTKETEKEVETEQEPETEESDPQEEIPEEGGDITPDQVKSIHVLAGKLWGKDFDKPYKEKLFTWTGKDSSKELTSTEGDNVIGLIVAELNDNMKSGKKWKK